MMLDMIHYKKFPFTDFKEISMFREAFHKFLPWIKHNLLSQFINTDFCITFISVRSSTVSTITRIYAGRSGVQILDAATELSFLQNIQAISCAHPASNPMNTKGISLAVK
jgi:hypothetical protein